MTILRTMRNFSSMNIAASILLFALETNRIYLIIYLSLLIN